MDLKKFIRAAPDFPKKGILFRDITPLLENPVVLEEVVEAFSDTWTSVGIDAIVALDARGFIFGGALAINMCLPLVLMRKKGKLPGPTESISYGLEYGIDTLEVRADSIKPGMRVLVIDDLLATGGTARAACLLAERLGATVAGCAFVIELLWLGGREALGDVRVEALVRYAENEP